MWGLRKQKTAGPQRGHAGHHDIHLLKNGNILFHDTWSKTQEVTLGKKTVWEYESAKINGNEGKGVDVHAFARFPDGSTIVAESGKDGKVVWEYSTKTRVFGAIRLKNGNTLIATGSGNSVIEVSPEKEIVWEIVKKVPGTEIELAWTTCLQELPNGNLVIGNCHAGENNPQIFEITKEKKVVWEFNEWDLVGNGLACWQILDSGQSAMVRKQLAELKK